MGALKGSSSRQNRLYRECGCRERVLLIERFLLKRWRASKNLELAL
jgi:hypothetical protein